MSDNDEKYLQALRDELKLVQKDLMDAQAERNEAKQALQRAQLVHKKVQRRQARAQQAGTWQRRMEQARAHCPTRRCTGRLGHVGLYRFD